MLIYYLVALLVNIILAFVFHGSISITVLSVVPIFLMGVSVFQSVYFHKHRAKKDFNINNDSPLTEEEWGEMAKCMRNAYLLCVPLFVPFIIFFPSLIKFIVSFVLFFVGFTGGSVYYRLRHGDKINERLLKEAEELEVQKKNEELGKWK